MTSAHRHPIGNPAHGATALSAVSEGLHHTRHLLGDALRAAQVFVTTAAEVALLGRVEEKPGERARPPARDH